MNSHPPMKRRPPLLPMLLVTLAAGLAGYVGWRHYWEPRFESKTTRQWFADYVAQATVAALPPPGSNAPAAVRFGTSLPPSTMPAQLQRAFAALPVRAFEVALDVLARPGWVTHELYHQAHGMLPRALRGRLPVPVPAAWRQQIAASVLLDLRGRIDETTAEPRLRELLRAGHAPAMAEAIHLLNLRGPQAARLLGDAFQAAGPQYAGAIHALLAACGSDAQAALPQLTAALESRDEIIRFWAVRCLLELGSLAGPSAPALALVAEGDPSELVRERARLALEQMIPVGIPANPPESGRL